MRVLFLQRDPIPRLSLLYLASSVRKYGHHCHLTITTLEDLQTTLEEWRPDLAAMSVNSGEYTWAKETAITIKKTCGIPVVIGGPHVIFFPEVVEEPCFDIACLGEADESFPKLLHAIELGSCLEDIPHLIYMEEGTLKRTRAGKPPELHSLPHPSYNLLERFGIHRCMGFFYLVASRGCPYHCSFCYAPVYRKLLYEKSDSFYRRRAPKAVIAELQYAMKIFPELRFIRFEDDTFNIPPANWLEEFSEAYASTIGIPFTCYLRLDLVTEHTAELLHKAGCRTVKVGIESGNPTVRNKIYNKGLSQEELSKGVHILQNQGLIIHGLNIVGAPGESFEQALQTYSLNLELGLRNADCSNLYIYPGSSFAAKSKDMKFEEPYFLFRSRGDETRREFQNLANLFPLGASFRIPVGAIKVLAKLPPNRFFKLAILLGQFLKKTRTEGGLELRQFVVQLQLAPVFLGISSRFLLSGRRRKSTRKSTKT